MPDAFFTVPYPEHTHFVGREDDLARLHAALQGEGPVGINPAVLGNPTGVTGQGGIGKTQLAVAYAYRYREHYPDGVYWLNAAESLFLEFANLGRHFLGQGGEGALRTRLYETLRTRFKVEEIRDLCFELGINDEEFSPQLGQSSLARELTEYCQRRGQLALLEAAVRRLRGELAHPEAQDELVAHAFARLREQPQSLLILDNVAEPAALDEPLTRDCVPARLPVRLLFTTRRRELGSFKPVELKTLTADAALRLLLRDPRRAPILDPAHSEHQAATDICAVFGYLPLALEIAAAHLAKFHAAPLSAYRDELRRRGALDVMADKHVAVKTRHETGLAAALLAQWATLGEEAQTVLRVAGQLPEAAYVPAARLGLLAGVHDEGQSFFDVTLDVALNELNDASFIEELAGDQVRLHPLVREFARDRTPIEEAAAFRVSCVRRLLAAVGDIATLERQCDARGIDALIRDLLAARQLLDRSGDMDTRSRLEAYLRVLRREAHNLRGWKKVNSPSFLAQQLHLRLFNSATPDLFGDLAARLRSQGATWQPRWAARSEQPTLEMTLTGHNGRVPAVAMTPDGQRAVSGGSDGTVRVWNLDTGESERVLTGHTGGVLAMAMTPNGWRAASGGSDGTLRVWKLDTGESDRTLIGHTGEVRTVALTPNGQRAISGGSDGTVRVWNLDTGNSEWVLPGHTGGVLAVTVTPDGRQAVSGGSDGTVRVWNLSTGDSRRMLVKQRGGVLAVAVTPDGRQAVSGGENGTLRVWNLDTGESKQTLTGHTGGVLAVAVTPNGRRAFSGGRGGTLRVWDLRKGRFKRILAGHTGGVLAVALTPDGRRAVSGGENGTLRVWNLNKGWSKGMSTGYAGGMRTVAVTPNGQRAISGGRDGTLRVWNLDTGESKRMLIGHEEWVQAVAVTPDGRAVSSGGDGTVRVWNLDTGESRRMLIRQRGGVLAITVTPDGRQAVLGGGDATLSIWNLETSHREGTLTGHQGRVRAVTVTPDGQRAVSGGEDGRLRVWNLGTGHSEPISVGEAVWVLAVVVTADGRRVVSGESDGMVRIWNLATGQRDRTLSGHEGRVLAVVVTPDGRRAISGGSDRMLRVWNLHTGRELSRTAFDAAITCLAIASTQPPLVVAGDAAGNVHCLEWVE